MSGKPQESVLFEMAYEALHVKLVIGNLLEYGFNQQILLPMFVLLTTRKVSVDKNFPYKCQVLVFFIISISLQFYLLPCGQKLHDAVFCKWLPPGLNKQIWCWRKENFVWLTLLPDTAIVSVQEYISFIITISLKFYSPPCVKPQITW